MHAMVGLWLLFAVVLFVAEPFILHRRFAQWRPASAGRLLCLAASGPLGSARAQPGHDLRRGRGQPGMVRVLTVRGNTAHRV